MFHILNEGAVSHFANQLKELRAKNQWSMQDLADRANVSKSMICKIEHEEVQPTIDVAARLASALGQTLSEMLHEPLNNTALLLTHDEQAVWVDAKQVKRRNILPVTKEAKLEWLQVSLPAHTVLKKLGNPSKREFKYFLVTKGHMECHMEGAIYKLKSGDSLYFDTSKNYEIHNSGKTDLEYYVVIQQE